MQNVLFTGNNKVKILYWTPDPGSRRLFIASPTCVSFFFFQTPVDVLFLQCQFAPSLPFWLPSNGTRNLIGQGCAFGHLGSDSQMANEFCVFVHCRQRTKDLIPLCVVQKNPLLKCGWIAVTRFMYACEQSLARLLRNFKHDTMESLRWSNFMSSCNLRQTSKMHF